MFTTSVSLLERLRQPAEQEAWTRFVQLYTPLIYGWARRVGLSPEDASDLVQDVFAALVSTQIARELNFKTPVAPVLRREGLGVRGFSV